jgi:hypothetical protein
VLARNIARIHKKVRTRRFDTKAAHEFIHNSAKSRVLFPKSALFLPPKGVSLSRQESALEAEIRNRPKAERDADRPAEHPPGAPHVGDGMVPESRRRTRPNSS